MARLLRLPVALAPDGRNDCTRLEAAGKWRLLDGSNSGCVGTAASAGSGRWSACKCDGEAFQPCSPSRPRGDSGCSSSPATDDTGDVGDDDAAPLDG